MKRERVSVELTESISFDGSIGSTSVRLLEGRTKPRKKRKKTSEGISDVSGFLIPGLVLEDRRDMPDDGDKLVDEDDEDEEDTAEEEDERCRCHEEEEEDEQEEEDDTDDEEDEDDDVSEQVKRLRSRDVGRFLLG